MVVIQLVTSSHFAIAMVGGNLLVSSYPPLKRGTRAMLHQFWTEGPKDYTLPASKGDTPLTPVIDNLLPVISHRRF